MIEEICRYHQFALEILQIIPLIIGATFKGNWQSLETLISNKLNEILPFKLHFILFGWNAMREINMFDWTHFQRKLMISGNSYKLTNEMKFFQSNFISFCLVGIQWSKSIIYVWLDTFPKEINDLWKLTNEMKFFQSSFISFCLAGIQWGKSISCPGEMKFGSEM